MSVFFFYLLQLELLNIGSASSFSPRFFVSYVFFWLFIFILMVNRNKSVRISLYYARDPFNFCYALIYTFYFSLPFEDYFYKINNEIIILIIVVVVGAVANILSLVHRLPIILILLIFFS